MRALHLCNCGIFTFILKSKRYWGECLVHGNTNGIELALPTVIIHIICCCCTVHNNSISSMHEYHVHIVLISFIKGNNLNNCLYGKWINTTLSEACCLICLWVRLLIFIVMINFYFISFLLFFCNWGLSLSLFSSRIDNTKDHVLHNYIKFISWKKKIA
jgi:hypothetical protein